ncbi:MAG: right-handed parallel beta-helix repeat-containing protein, partial [Planctomycetaceae bacterium]
MVGSATAANLTTVAYVDPDATGKPSAVVTVAASDITIENLVIRDGVGVGGAGIQFDDAQGRHHVAIDHVEILNNALAGIQIGDTASSAADQHQFTRITGSHIHDNQAVGGIVLGNASNTDIRGNVVLHNAGDGVLVQQRASNTNTNIGVRENNIWGNSGLAVDLESAGQDAVFGVTFNDKSDTTNSDSDLGANNLQNTPEILYAFVTRDVGGQLDELTIIYHVPSATGHSQYGMEVAFYLSDYFGDLASVPNAPATGPGGFSDVAALDLDGREAAGFLWTDIYDSTEALSTRTFTIPATALGSAAAAVLNQADVASFVTPVRIVAAATDLNNNTSEFSRAAVINPRPGEDPQSQADLPPAGPAAYGPRLDFIDELSATGFLFTPGPVAPLASEVATLRFDWTTEGDHAHNPAYPWAIFDNEFGFYPVVDASGAVGGVSPSFNSTYAQNAFTAHTALRNSDKSDALNADLSQTGIVHAFNPHDRLAWYLVSNTSSQVLVGPTGEHPTGAGGAPIGNYQPNPLNNRPGPNEDTAVAFFSYLAANPDSLNHVRTKLRKADDEVNSLFQLTGDPGTDGVFDNGDFTGELQIYWEQALDLGDFAFGIRDGEDAVITAIDPFVEPIPAAVSKEPASSSSALLASSLDASLGLHTTGNLFENWGGLGEKWLQDADGQWFFILPNGEFYRWNGSPSSALSGTFVAALNAGFHADPVTLYAAYDAPQAQALDTSLNLKNTGNLHLNWGGLNEKWIRDDVTSQWYYVTPSGSLFEWSGGGTAVGSLIATLGAEYYVDPSLLYYSQSYSVIKPLGMESTGNLHENWGGLGEKWLQNLSTSQWYFITPDGNAYAWDGSPSSALSGVLQGNVSATFQAEMTVPFMSDFLAKFSR